MKLSHCWLKLASCWPTTLKKTSSSMIRLRFNSPGLVSCRSQSKLVPCATGPIAPIIWLGTSKNSNILNQPSPVGLPTSVPPVSAALDAPV